MTLTLVTGGGGFIGAHVAAALLRRGERVRALDLDPDGAPEGAERIAGSILDGGALAAATAGAAAVIHCAAVSALWTPRRGEHDRVNRVGSAAVAAAARAAGARLVQVSSFMTLVGGPARAGPYDETSEIAPEATLGPYARSKRAAELEVCAAGGDVVTALLSAPVGPGDRAMTAPTRLLRDLAAGALPALIDAPINMVDVRALAEGLVAARDRGAPGRRYLLCGEDMEMSAFAALAAAASGTPAPARRVPAAIALAAACVEAALAGALGRPPAAPREGVRFAIRRPRFSAARARDELGFVAPPLGPAVADAIEWLRRTGRI